VQYPRASLQALEDVPGVSVYLRLGQAEQQQRSCQCEHRDRRRVAGCGGCVSLVAHGGCGWMCVLVS
jgi:hypothetical protein